MSEEADLQNNEILLAKLADHPIDFKYPLLERVRSRLLGRHIDSAQQLILDAFKAMRNREGGKIVANERETPNGQAVLLKEEWLTEFEQRTGGWPDED